MLVLFSSIQAIEYYGRLHSPKVSPASVASMVWVLPKQLLLSRVARSSGGAGLESESDALGHSSAFGHPFLDSSKLQQRFAAKFRKHPVFTRIACLARLLAMRN